MNKETTNITMDTAVETRPENKTLQLVLIAVMAAVICVLGPLSIPIGPVPISLTNLAIYFALYILGTKKGTLSFLVYLLLGTVGVPVFSGFSGGIGKLLGPTGGYIIGFFFMAIVAGIFIDKFPKKFYMGLIGMILGTMIAYLFGTLWFMYVQNCGMLKALTLCVFPFIIGDLIKMVLAMSFGPLIRKQLIKAGLFHVEEA